jgi:serine/threonine protein kinase
MEFVAGITLEDRIRAEGPLPVREVVRIGLQSARGLAAALARGLVHRDVKPGNILLEGGTGRVKLTDFGLARAADDASLTQSGTVAGTPSFMSPEQAEGKPVDPRSDLFSLGSVLYAMCTGRPPFRAGTGVAVLKRVCEESPRPIREVNPDLPAWLAELVGRLHAKTPAGRPASAREVAELLSRRLAELQDGNSALPARTIGGHGRRWFIASVVLLAVGLIGLTLKWMALDDAAPEAQPRPVAVAAATTQVVTTVSHAEWERTVVGLPAAAAGSPGPARARCTACDARSAAPLRPRT